VHKRNHTKHLLHRTTSTPSAADATIAEAIASSSTSTFSSSSMGSTTPHRKLYTIFLRAIVREKWNSRDFMKWNSRDSEYGILAEDESW
jgi:hypothetical protein